MRADFIRNEDKFSKRAKRSISIFDFSEETEEHHPEIAVNNLEEEAILNETAEQVRAAIALLHQKLHQHPHVRILDNSRYDLVCVVLFLENARKCLIILDNSRFLPESRQ